MPTTGAILWRPVNSTPSGYLLCDGASFTTASQAALFAVIGYTYGGAGANFNVPNLTSPNRHPLGSSTNARGVAAGTSGHTHSQSHTHSVTAPDAHPTHNTQGGHNHDTHSGGLKLQSALDNTANIADAFTHNNQGGHDHTGAGHAHGASTADNNATPTGSTDVPFLTLRPVIKT